MSFARILTQGIETTESVASFAQMDYKLDDATTLTLGGRFTYEKRKLSDAAFAVTLVAGPTINLPVTAQKSVTAKEPTWRIALTHNNTDEHRVGQECVCTVRSLWSTYIYKKKNKRKIDFETKSK